MQLAARCSSTGATRLPERDRRKDSSAPAAAVPATVAVTAEIRAPRLMRRPLVWAGVALVNLSAMTLFIWHQTAFITVSSVGLLAGRVPGLLTAPTGGAWVAERLAWLPMFAIVLSGLCLVFRRAERALGAAKRATHLREPAVE